MKTIKLMPMLTAALLVVLLASCGPSYVGVRSAPNYGYYGPGPYYGYRYAPYGYYRRPPVIVQRRTYVVPRTRYYNRPSSPNARNNNGGYRNQGPRYNGGGGSRGPR